MRLLQLFVYRSLWKCSIFDTFALQDARVAFKVAIESDAANIQ